MPEAALDRERLSVATLAGLVEANWASSAGAKHEERSPPAEGGSLILAASLGTDSLSRLLEVVMLARDLARGFPTVTLDTDALDAARMLAEHRLPGLVVLDGDGQPYTVLPGSQVLRFVVPIYVQDDPALARAYDEKSADQMCLKLAMRQVRDVLPKRGDVLDLPIVPSDATAIEVAARMAGTRSPIVAVVDGSRWLGAITVSELLAHLLDTGNPR